MRKKILAILVCVAFVVVIAAGCSAQTAATESGAPASDAAASETQAAASSDTAASGKKIFMTNAFNTAPFCAPLDAAAIETAQGLGLTLDIVDGQADAQVQLDQVKNAISQGYDGIIYFPADKESSITIVKELDASGVPYIIIDSQVDDSVKDLIPAFAGPDNINMGEIAGQACVDALGGKGNVVILEGAAGTDPATNRQKGFLNIVEQYPDIKILASQNVDGWDPAKALTIMQDYITRFGDEIDFVYTHDDGIFQGAAQALEEAGMLDKIVGVSTGANNVGCQMIEDGVLYGSVLHSAKEEGQLGVQALYDLMNGQLTEKWYKCSSPLVTKDNLEEWRGWGW